MCEFIIRKGKKDDFDQVIPLIIMAIEDLANQFTSSQDPIIVKERMRAAYNTPKTRFSKEYAVIIETKDRAGKKLVAGAGFAYPGGEMKDLTQGTLEACQGVGAVYQTKEIQRLVNSKEAQSDEFYIDNLAVYETYRGKGLSKLILNTLELEGKQQGYKKISILADINNPKAKSIYEKSGYVADDIYEVLSHRYHHLVKLI